MTNALQKSMTGGIKPSDIAAISSSVLTGLTALAALGIGGLATPEIAAVSIVVGTYGLFVNTQYFNDWANWSGNWLASGQYETDLSKSFLKFAFDLGSTLNGIEQSVALNFTAAQRFIQRFGDPLTLDLNGDGIHTVPLKTPPLLFDIHASGIKISTGWIAPDDGFLVLDRNGNGRIDDGSELFGDATPRLNAAGQTVGKTANGFAALAQEDTNHDWYALLQPIGKNKFDVSRSAVALVQ